MDTFSKWESKVGREKEWTWGKSHCRLVPEGRTTKREEEFGQDRSKINNSNFQIKKSGKEEQIKLKTSRREAMIKIKAEINEIQTRK